MRRLVGINAPCAMDNQKEQKIVGYLTILFSYFLHDFFFT
jgi:hypothetical protein